MEVLYDDEEDKPSGVILTRYSDDACKTENITTEEGVTQEITVYSFTTVVLCDPTVTAAGGGVITQVDKADKCSPIV